jgi:DnaJ-class molecular chaperone
MQLFLTYDKSLMLVNTYQALRTLNVDSSSSQDEIKTAYRKMALECHPDKNKDKTEDEDFKKITEAYNYLKKNHNQHQSPYQDIARSQKKPKNNFKRKPQWGAPEDGSIPEQDWGKYTREFEEGDDEMENMRKQKNPKNNQTYLWM